MLELLIRRILKRMTFRGFLHRCSSTLSRRGKIEREGRRWENFVWRFPQMTMHSTKHNAIIHCSQMERCCSSDETSPCLQSLQSAWRGSSEIDTVSWCRVGTLRASQALRVACKWECSLWWETLFYEKEQSNNYLAQIMPAEGIPRSRSR